MMELIADFEEVRYCFSVSTIMITEREVGDFTFLIL